MTVFQRGTGPLAQGRWAPLKNFSKGALFDENGPLGNRLPHSEKMNKNLFQGNGIWKVIEEYVWTRLLHLKCEVNVRLVCHFVNCYGILGRNQEAQ